MAVNIPGMLVVIVFYMAVMSVGVWSGRKVHNWRESGRRVSHTSIYRHSRAETSEDRNVYLLKLFVANRDMPVLVGIASLTATWVGAGYLLGSAAAVFSYGILYVQAPIGYAISLLCGGLFFAQKMRNTKSLTMIDPLQQHYGRWIGLLLSLTAAVADIFWTAATFTTLGQMANVILGVDGTMFIVATAMCTFTYTGLGGLYSVAYTDILQLAITIVGMWICVVFCATSKVAGMLGPPDNQWQGPSRGTGFLQMVDSFLMAVCGGIPWQVYFQRVLASRTVFDAKMLSYMTALGCLAVSVPAVVIGGIAKNANFTAAGYKGPYNLRESEHTQVLALSMHWLCPGMVSVFGLNALLAAIMSSVDSSMLSAATVITRNIYQYVVRPSATDTEMAVVLRAMICLLGALSALLALSVTSVIDLWMAASDVVFVLLFPQLLSLFYLNKWTNSYGAFLGFVVGAVLRGLCGERSLGIPVVLQLPMYDAVGGEQRFPFRTFCMLTSLSAMMVGSHMARMCFESGWLPKTFDVCGCFEDTRARRRASSFYGDKELSKSVLTPPGGPSSNDAEPPSHAETGAVLSSPEDDAEHPPHTHAEAQDHRSNVAEAPDNRTNVVEAQEHGTIMAEAQDHRTNTAEAHDHRHRTNTAEAHDHRANAAEPKERSRRKSSVSAKKKRRASKHAVTSPTKRGEDDPGAEAAAKTSP